jgi:hypothetical protein
MLPPSATSAFPIIGPTSRSCSRSSRVVDTNSAVLRSFVRASIPSREEHPAEVRASASSAVSSGTRLG